jgi:histone-lysine N-methyltransferase SETD3
MSSKKSKLLFNNLLKWLHENGSKFNHVSIQHYSDVFRGVVATKFIHKNKIIVKIPLKCIMTQSKAKDTLVGKEIENSTFSPDNEHTWLALYLLNEKMDLKNSFWRPYIETLPKHYNNFPHFYGKKTKLKELKGSLILNMIKSRKLDLKKDLDKILEKLPDFKKRITNYVTTKFKNNQNVDIMKEIFNEYLWARIAVISRVFGHKNSESGLVPLCDMLNHTEKPGTEWKFLSDEKCFVIISTKNILKNMEIYDTYGGKCNSRYLVNYGFTLCNNDKYNSTELFFNVSKILENISSLSSTEIKQKMNILCEKNKFFNLDDGYSGYSLLISENEESKINENKMFRFQVTKLMNIEKKQFSQNRSYQISYYMLNFLRFLVSNDEKWIAFQNIYNNNKIPFIYTLQLYTPVSFENEVLVLRTLRNVIKNKLKTFKTYLKDDLRDVENLEKFSTEWNIKNMLISEKKVLDYYLNLSNTVIENWESKKFKELNKILKNDYKNYYNYIWKKIMNN